MLSSMNKKFLFIIGGIFGAMILIIIVVALARSCDSKTSNHGKVENKLVSAAKKYFESNADKMPKEGETAVVTDVELTEAGFFKGMSKVSSDTSCVGKVTVHNNGGEKLVIPDLVCSEYKTQHLGDKIISEQLVSESDSDYTEEENTSNSNEDKPVIIEGKDYISGLYKESDGYYVFKGQSPNNNVVISGKKFKIIDISPEGIIRLINMVDTGKSTRWDTKHNAEIAKGWGVNDYKNSFIITELVEKYKTFSADNRKHLAPFNACVGKRSSENHEYGLDRSIDCSSVLEKQYMSLISIADFGRASLDENCTDVKSQSCVNYNYLNSAISQTWTTSTISDNTYEVLYISGGMSAPDKANTSKTYKWIVSVHSDELFVSGNGTESDPYVVGSKK